MKLLSLKNWTLTEYPKLKSEFELLFEYLWAYPACLPDSNFLSKKRTRNFKNI